MYDSLHRLNTERPKGCQNAWSDSLQMGYFPIETKTVISVSLVDSQRWIWWKGRRSSVSYFFLSKLGVLFVFCLFVSFLLCFQHQTFSRMTPRKNQYYLRTIAVLSTIDQNDYRRCRYHSNYSFYLPRTNGPWFYASQTVCSLQERTIT